MGIAGAFCVLAVFVPEASAWFARMPQSMAGKSCALAWAIGIVPLAGCWRPFEPVQLATESTSGRNALVRQFISCRTTDAGGTTSIGHGDCSDRKLEGSTSMAKRKAQKRELISTGNDKRFVRRDTGGKFSESDDVGKSLSRDRRRKAKRTVKAGHGDRGDRRQGRAR